ncbi:hypothetical protein CDAR_506311 [Caerostris darwini]|uniref:Uncharacterized protein n=1 Tax=Caerostris darwini TaxID=1538125 RepID=A0AAV4WRI4_9ARAC|nr:hypothetical protein CDAR_506311 [Caerostris darwini]
MCTWGQRDQQAARAIQSLTLTHEPIYLRLAFRLIMMDGLIHNISGRTDKNPKKGRGYLPDSFCIAGTIENIFPSEGQWMVFSKKWKRDVVTLDVSLEGGKA